MPTVTLQERKKLLSAAKRGLKALIAYGQLAFKPEANATDSECLGMALARLTEDRMLVEVIPTALEDMNMHTASAVFEALNKGNYQKVGNVVTITLEG